MMYSQTAKNKPNPHISIFFLMLCCHRSCADVETDQTVEAPCSVLTLVDEQPHPVHGLTGQ